MSTIGTPDPNTIAHLRAVAAAARRGDLTAAAEAGARGLAEGADPAVLHGLLGMIHAQARDFAPAVEHLREAHALRPDDIGAARNLVTALIESGDVAGALDACSAEVADRDAAMAMWRLRAYLLQQQEDFAAAAEAYRRVLAAHPDDFTSWNNLGNACAALGDGDGCIAALERAVALDRGAAPARHNLASALIQLGRLEEAATVLEAYARDFPADSRPLRELCPTLKRLGRDAEALEALERAAAIDLDDVALWNDLGAERAITWRMEEAEQAFRHVLARDPASRDAHLQLGNLYEHMNRAAELPGVIAAAELAGCDAGALAFLRALEARRDKRFADGLAALAEVPEDIEPARSAQLAGQFHDRLGNADAAFAAFTAMNRVHAEDPSEPVRRGAEYRARLRADRAVVTPEWAAGWQADEAPSAEESPIFLLGFPRSGTTLLDTMLMGHPRLRVLEERSPIAHVEKRVGEMARIAALDAAEIEELRALYWREAAQWVTLEPGIRLVDKFPLHLNKVPWMHRLFPHARYILALRHPCDAVLSCYITNFRLNAGMSSFLDLEHAAEVYDQSFGFWEQSRALFPIAVREIRYENMVADSAAELRPLFDFLGLEWQADVLDHQRTAGARGTIYTASYAQVTEPLYQRAAGRWEKYRAHMAPVLPTLAPWAAHFGYAL